VRRFRRRGVQHCNATCENRFGTGVRALIVGLSPGRVALLMVLSACRYIAPCRRNACRPTGGESICLSGCRSLADVPVRI
jgi:hypothetical protein